MRKQLFETGLDSLARILTSTYKNCEVRYANGVVPNCTRVGRGKNVRWIITLPALNGVDVSDEDAEVIKWDSRS